MHLANVVTAYAVMADSVAAHVAMALCEHAIEIGDRGENHCGREARRQRLITSVRLFLAKFGYSTRANAKRTAHSHGELGLGVCES